MLLAGILFDIGVVLTAGALNLYMLMAGRVLLGIAVAFASVSVTLYNSEMAPAQLRGRLNQLFQVGAWPCLQLCGNCTLGQLKTCFLSGSAGTNTLLAGAQHTSTVKVLGMQPETRVQSSENPLSSEMTRSSYGSLVAQRMLRMVPMSWPQVILTLGVVLAQIINIATGKYYPWGWRVSLGLAGLPAIILTIGGIVLPDTPNSLVERGFEEEGRRVG